MAVDESLLKQLDELLSAVRAAPDPRRATAEWKRIYSLLQKTDLPGGRYQAVVGMRNVVGLADLIGQLRDPETAPAEQTIDPDTLRKALHAFRKRAKLTRLDDESKLGRGPLSKGADASLGAIQPPNEFPEAVWQELARQGKLKYLGHGMYELPR